MFSFYQLFVLVHNYIFLSLILTIIAHCQCKVNLGEVARTSGGGVLDVEDPKVEERMGDVLAAEVDALVSDTGDDIFNTISP